MIIKMNLEYINDIDFIIDRNFKYESLAINNDLNEIILCVYHDENDFINKFDSSKYDVISDILDGFNQICLNPSYGLSLNMNDIIEYYREEKVNYLRESHQIHLRGGLEVTLEDGSTCVLQSEPKDQSNWTSIAQFLNLNCSIPSVDIADIQNVTHTVSREYYLNNLFIELGVKYQLVFQHKFMLRNSLLGYDKLEDILDVEWSL